MKTKPVTTRMDVDTFAKVLDSLIAQGIPKNKLITNSAIVRTALLLAIANAPEPTAPASQESIDTIKQLWKVTKRDKKINLDELY